MCRLRLSNLSVKVQKLLFALRKMLALINDCVFLPYAVSHEVDPLSSASSVYTCMQSV
jgi:hypothetical protein